MKEWKLDGDDQKDDNYPLFYHLIKDQILVVTCAKKDRGILVALYMIIAGLRITLFATQSQ